MNMDLVQHKKELKIILSTLLAIVVLYGLFHGCGKKNLAPQPPVTVIIEKPTVINVTDFITKTGNAVAYNSVNLVARVKGYLLANTFVDGAIVKKNQELFLLETDPYQEQLDEALASVAAAKAMHTYNTLEYARQRDMYKDNATSLNSVQKWAAKVAESQADVDKAEAQVKSARVTLSYTRVRAPFTGRIGRHLVDPGNLVGDGLATKLAVLEQISPLYIYFDLDVNEVSRLQNLARSKGMNFKNIGHLKAIATLQTTKKVIQQGTLDFVSTGLDASTGTLQFRAQIPNKDYTFLPGMFVQVQVLLSKALPRLSVPDTALQFDQIGAYVLVVNSQHQVVLQRVSTGSSHEGRRVIISGLSRNDDVIVDGLQFVTPGNTVNPRFASERATS